MTVQDPLGSSVISITQLDAGTAFNVIPDDVTLQGTVRALDHGWMHRLHQRIEEASPHLVYSMPAPAAVLLLSEYEFAKNDVQADSKCNER